MSTEIPRMFALTRMTGDAEQIVGWGLEMPDGSAISVSWPDRIGPTVFSTNTAEECAEARNADLLWVSEM